MKPGGEQMEAEQRDHRTMSEIIEDARAAGVPPEKIAVLEAKRDQMRVKLAACDRVDACKVSVAAFRAKDVTLAADAVRVEEDLQAAERRAEHLLREHAKMLQPFQVQRDEVARLRVENAARLQDAERDLTDAQAAEKAAWNLPGGAA